MSLGFEVLLGTHVFFARGYTVFEKNCRCPRITRLRANKRGTTDLKLALFPARSPLPFATLPSISLIPSARFTDDADKKQVGRHEFHPPSPGLRRANGKPSLLA